MWLSAWYAAREPGAHAAPHFAAGKGGFGVRRDIDAVAGAAAGSPRSFFGSHESTLYKRFEHDLAISQKSWALAREIEAKQLAVVEAEWDTLQIGAQSPISQTLWANRVCQFPITAATPNAAKRTHVRGIIEYALFASCERY